MRPDRRTLAAGTVVALVVLLATACGGGGSDLTFTRANYEKLVANAGAYGGAHVDIVGQVVQVERTDDGVFFDMFAKPAENSWGTVVGVDDPNFMISEYDWVRVVGEVDPDLEIPEYMNALSAQPYIRATSVTPAEPLG